MAGKESAGLLMYRRKNNGVELFLAHPGGPFFKNKDDGSWSIPKGLLEEAEEPLEAAKREFEEETGITPKPPFIPLESIKQKGGKLVYAWAFEGDVPAGFKPVSNHFEMEWPPHSGKKQSFPEMDKMEFFSAEEAKAKINPAQANFIDRLLDTLSGL